MGSFKPTDLIEKNRNIQDISFLPRNVKLTYLFILRVRMLLPVVFGKVLLCQGFSGSSIVKSTVALAEAWSSVQH